MSGANTVYGTFAAAPEPAVLEAAAKSGVRVDRYRVEDVVAVAGERPPDPRAGWRLVRWEAPHPVASTAPVAYLGVTRHLEYTSAEQVAELSASRGEFPAGADTRAVLIPIRKRAEWWALPQDRRQEHFRASGARPGHTRIGQAYVERVYRKLYHARYLTPDAPFDFLTYFEFARGDEPLFRELLAKLRNRDTNPEWSFVDREFEVWMTKRPD